MKSTAVSKIAAIAALAFALAGCSSEPQEEPKAAPTGTAAEAAEVIESFVAKAASDEVAKALPGDSEGDVFKPALDLVSADASSAEVLTAVLTEFALLKVSNPDVEIVATVDPKKISVEADNATVHSGAVVVKSNGDTTEATEKLAAHFTELTHADGAWQLVFTEEKPEPSASPSPSATSTSKATEGSK